MAEWHASARLICKERIKGTRCDMNDSPDNGKSKKT
jgi:hypothetical protein